MQKQSLDRLLRSRISPSGFEQAFFHASNVDLGLKLVARLELPLLVTTYESMKHLLPFSNSHEDSTLHAIEIFNGNLASAFYLVENVKSEDSLQRFLRFIFQIKMIINSS